MCSSCTAHDVPLAGRPFSQRHTGVGAGDGAAVGAGVGLGVGLCVGTGVGAGVGAVVGLGVGLGVGELVMARHLCALCGGACGAGSQQ